MSVSGLLHHTKTSQLVKPASASSVWDNYNQVNSRGNPVESTSNRLLETTTAQKHQAYPVIKQSRQESQIPPFLPLESIGGLNANEAGAYEQLNDQAGPMSNAKTAPDERTIQSVIRETIPKPAKDQNRWAVPMFAQSADFTAFAATKGIDQFNNGNQRDSASQFQQQLSSTSHQRQDIPWRRVLAAPLAATATVSSYPRPATVMPLRAGVRVDRKSRGSGQVTAAQWWIRANSSLPPVTSKQKQLTGQFFATTSTVAPSHRWNVNEVSEPHAPTGIVRSQDSSFQQDPEWSAARQLTPGIPQSVRVRTLNCFNFNLKIHNALRST